MSQQQHIVPRFLLRNFAITGKPGHIYVYQRQQTPFQASIRSVCAEKDYYNVKGSGIPLPKDGVETLLGQLESGAAPIIKHLLTATNSRLHPNDKNVLSLFVAAQNTRTPHFRYWLQEMYRTLMNEKAKAVAADRDMLRAELQRVGVTLESEQELAELQESFLSVDKHFNLLFQGAASDDHFLGKALEKADFLQPMIEGKEIHMVESLSSQVFVISDNPVTLLIPREHSSAKTWGFVNASILIPISPRRALLFRNRKAGADILRINREGVDYLNCAIQSFAVRQVYSNIVSQHIRDEFDKTSGPDEKKVRSQKV
jgi:hypothetical protein